MKAAPIPPNEIERLAVLTEAAILDTPAETGFDDLTKLAARICGVPIALVSLVDTRRQWFKSRVGLDAAETPREFAFCAHAILEEDVFVVPDAYDDERFFDNPLVRGAPNVRFYAGAPLTSDDGFNVGTLCVIDHEPRVLSAEQLETLRGLARQAAAQIDLRRVNNRLKRINQALTLRAREVESAWAQLDDLLDNSSDLIQSLDPQGRITYVNRAWCDAFGYSLEEAKHLSHFEVIAPEYVAHCSQVMTQLAQRETPPSFDFVALTKTGQRLVLEGRITARIENDKLVSTRGVFRNVTDQRRTLERVRLYADVVEHVQIGLLVWEGNAADLSTYRLTAKNGAADQMLTRLGTLSTDGSLAELPPLLVAANLPDVVAQVHRTHSPARLDDIEVGGYFISTLVFPLPGRFVGIAFEDVSQRKSVERLKDEFISTVSHELRTPLTSIRGALGLMSGGVTGPIPDDAQELLTIAISNTERLVRLINDILDLDKIDAGQFDLRMAPLNVADMVASVVDQMRPLAAEAHVKLIQDVRGRREIVADEDRLMQVLTNLVSNAIKFSPKEGAVHIRVVTLPSGNAWFAIVDEGPGITDVDKSRLFNRFQQLDAGDRRSKGGTGLGLAISKAIIEQHGGTIGVNSEVGRGSTFWFELPIVDTMRPAEIVAGQTILIVEDDPVVARAFRRQLEHEGFKLVHAPTLYDARAFLSSDASLAAIVLDLMLPDGSGFDLIGHLRKTPHRRHTPVVVLSATERDGRMDDVPELVDWLVKPFDMSRLANTLHWVCHDKTRPRVLVVEDDPSFRNLVARQLSTQGAEVVLASTGDEGVRLARASAPDLVVLDVGLPRMDGFAFVAALRSDRLRGLPLIVYTGRDLSDGERDTLRLGITRFLTKSRASEAEFARHVRELLRSPPGSSRRPPPPSQP